MEVKVKIPESLKKDYPEISIRPKGGNVRIECYVRPMSSLERIEEVAQKIIEANPDLKCTSLDKRTDRRGMVVKDLIFNEK